MFGNTFASGSQTQRGKLVSNDFDFHSVKSQQTGQKNFESNFDSKNCKKELEQSKPIVLLDNNEEFGNSANSSQISLDVS